MNVSLIVLSDDEARAELKHLGASFADDPVAGLDALGLLPRVILAGQAGIPCVALPLVLAATVARSTDHIDETRSGLSTLVSFVEASTDEARHALVALLRRWLAQHAVLGDLASLLGVASKAALESLRGVARAEWRVRQALDSLDGFVKAPALDARSDVLTGPRKRLLTVPSLPTVRAGAEAAVEPAQRWSEANAAERHALVDEVVRTRTLDEWLASLDENEPLASNTLLLDYADTVLNEGGDAAEACRALALAFSRADDAERRQIGLRRVRVARDAGLPGHEVDALDDVLPHTQSLERVANILRLAEVLEVELKRPTEAADRLVAAVASGTFDDDVVQRASRLLEAERRWPVLLGVLRTAARAARRPERRGQLYRRIATLALHHLDDVSESIALVREGMDATRGDPRLASQLADLAVAASDRVAERAALEALIAAPADRLEARRVDRLITVLLDLGDTDAAVELVEELLARQDRDSALDTVLDRRLRDVADASEDVTARARWLRRRAERETSPVQALALWQQIVEHEELLGVDSADRLTTIQQALDAAEAGAIEPGDVAELHVAAATLRLELGETTAAGQHLASLGQSALRVTGAHARIGSLVDLVATSDAVDDIGWDALHEIVLATGDPDLLVEWARIASDAQRWQVATASLEMAVDALAGDEARSAAVIRDLARLYERTNAAVES